MRAFKVASLILGVFVGAFQARAADLPVKARPVVPVKTGGQFWAEAEYLYWQLKGDALPALVTSGGSGALGGVGTTVVFGGSAVNEDWLSGGRVRGGYWFDPARKSGLEAHFFGLERASTDFHAASDGALLLARPFFNTALGVQDALLIASPFAGPGQISVSETSRLLGAGAAYRSELCVSCMGGSATAFIGYRYLQLRDKLRIASSQTSILFAASFAVEDEFDTSNHFHGVDLGVMGLISRGPWTFEWRASAALGATFTDLSIHGSTTTVVGGVTTTGLGGLLALPTNIGEHSDDRFSIVPEFNARLGYQITPQWRAFAGYNVIYWSEVVRPGGAIDTTVNPTQLPPGALVGVARPAVQFNTTDFWTHGVSFGIAFNY